MQNWAFMLGFVLGLATALGPARAADVPCGAEAACTLPGGSYHLMGPADWDGVTPLPAMIFYHGFRSSGLSALRSAGLRADFADQGYLVIAPNGARMRGSEARAWPARDEVDPVRDDVAFSLAVLDDVAARLPIDAARVYVSGFSAGGSMAWRMACLAGDRFAGAASVAGALRRPPEIPDTCPTGPIRLIQIHGFADAQVPFEGRAIRDWHQGDLFAGLALVRRTNGCRSNPDSIVVEDPFWCRTWADSCDSGAIALCLHPGGHGLPRGWTARARAFLEDGVGE
ncbi:MAG: alpha/beta fold hydrolase [Pseudomonadota bacterium]